MLFCFGLFALLLYYTVVANAECSYTYRHSSQQPIEARSWEFQNQGFTRCQFLIQLVNKHQQLRLNFTRLTGFGLSSPPSQHGAATLDGAGEQEEEEEEAEEEKKEGWRGEGGRGGGGGGGGGDTHRTGWSEEKDDERTGGQSQRSRFFTPTTRRSMVDVGKDGRQSEGLPSSTPAVDRSSQHAPEGGATTSTTTTTPWSRTLSGSRPVSPMTTVWPEEGLRKVLDYGVGSPSCLPMVEIRAVDTEGREGTVLHRICRQPHAAAAVTHTPIVFQYSSSVRIVYEWALGHHSGFTLFFHFSNVVPQPERCVHTCDGATRCLSEKRMLCDGRYDCRDRSDEHATVCRLSTSPSASRPLAEDEDERLVQVVVISSCAVVVVVVLLSAVCFIGRRRWPGGPHSVMHRGHGGHHATPRSCLQSHSSESSVTRACSSHECSEQAVALLSSSHRSHISWPSSHSHPCHHHPHPHPPAPPPPPPPHPPSRDPHIELPPNIPVSPDGEEGYPASQQNLRHPRYHAAHSDLLFRPPPNKTVFDRESPPPYSVAPSPGTYASRSAPCPSPVGVGRGGLGWPGHERSVGDSLGQLRASGCRSATITPPDHPPPLQPSVRGHLSRSSANPGCAASPDPQTFPILHGACRKTDSQSPPVPPSPCVVPVSLSPASPSPPPPPSSSPTSPAVSSSPAFSSPASCSAVLLLSSSEEAAVVSSPSHSRTTLPCQLVWSAGVGPDKRDSRGNSSSGDSSGEDRPRASHPAQLGAPASSCQGAFSWTRTGEDST